MRNVSLILELSPSLQIHTAATDKLRIPALGSDDSDPHKMDRNLIKSYCRKQHEGYFGTDLEIFNLGQMTRTTPELAPVTKSSVESGFEPGTLRPQRRPYH
ncbi:hypothetical protein AVEN_251475-1 [Araneus ventricosus]|uniref:Uncharacterized protein n=1 Tax=Araneus ventricosus TaxID=182803 RepID=A0A4Y2SI23_ARAVE|nr:hypothetical protein AVEN_251475-1 [Araneus ventricosus]